MNDDRLLEAVRAYQESLPSLDAGLDDAVMAAVRARATPARRRAGWRWLVEPQSLKVRPIWAPVLAAAAAFTIWIAGRGPAPVAPDPLAGARAAALADTVFVHFQLAAPGARVVAVAGSFNDWRPEAQPMVLGRDGWWSITVPLPVGEHRYQFVVDGARWLPDPSAHAQVDDGFGGANSVIVVGPRGLVRS
ncbi:MAG: isoamylase early set domain-containing protein [Gemmatimonadales bacterium]|nr:isoamylase early set domain-containing protein [Gemmatimonadales bacterium]